MSDLAEVMDPPKTRRWVRVILIVICALIAAMWVYAFGFATKTGVYFVTEKGWRTSAEQICVQRRTQLALADTSQGYISKPTHAEMIQRADIVDRATDTLDRDGRRRSTPCRSPAPTTRNGSPCSSSTTASIIGDRAPTPPRLRAFDLEPYRETLVKGSPVTNTVIDFTTGNDIPHCMPPGELGGDT